MAESLPPSQPIQKTQKPKEKLAPILSLRKRAAELWRSVAIERLKSAFDSLPKTHRYAAIGAGLVLVFSLGFILLNSGSGKQSFETQPLNLPSPSPLVATRFADHPTVRASEAALKAVRASLDAQKITDTPLLPPPLDMEINLNP